MKLIIEIDEYYFEIIKHDFETGVDYKPFEIIANGKPYEERPPGEWIWLGDNPNSNHKWTCNKCGHSVKSQENFCSNCGVDMRRCFNEVNDK